MKTFVVTHHKEYVFRIGNTIETVVAEICDNERGFGFRLRVGDQVGDPIWHYESFAYLKSTVTGLKYGLCSSFWGEPFIPEQPFIVVDAMGTES